MRDYRAHALPARARRQQGDLQLSKGSLEMKGYPTYASAEPTSAGARRCWKISTRQSDRFVETLFRGLRGGAHDLPVWQRRQRVGGIALRPGPRQGHARFDAGEAPFPRDSADRQHRLHHRARERRGLRVDLRAAAAQSRARGRPPGRDQRIRELAERAARRGVRALDRHEDDRGDRLRRRQAASARATRACTSRSTTWGCPRRCTASCSTRRWRSCARSSRGPRAPPVSGARGLGGRCRGSRCSENPIREYDWGSRTRDRRAARAARRRPRRRRPSSGWARTRARLRRRGSPARGARCSSGSRRSPRECWGRACARALRGAAFRSS